MQAATAAGNSDVRPAHPGGTARSVRRYRRAAAQGCQVDPSTVRTLAQAIVDRAPTVASASATPQLSASRSRLSAPRNGSPANSATTVRLDQTPRRRPGDRGSTSRNSCTIRVRPAGTARGVRVRTVRPGDSTRPRIDVPGAGSTPPISPPAAREGKLDGHRPRLRIRVVRVLSRRTKNNPCSSAGGSARPPSSKGSPSALLPATCRSRCRQTIISLDLGSMVASAKVPW